MRRNLRRLGPEVEDPATAAHLYYTDRGPRDAHGNRNLAQGDRPARGSPGPDARRDGRGDRRCAARGRGPRAGGIPAPAPRGHLPAPAPQGLPARRRRPDRRLPGRAGDHRLLLLPLPPSPARQHARLRRLRPRPDQPRDRRRGGTPANGRAAPRARHGPGARRRPEPHGGRFQKPVLARRPRDSGRRRSRPGSSTSTGTRSRTCSRAASSCRSSRTSTARCSNRACSCWNARGEASGSSITIAACPWARGRSHGSSTVAPRSSRSGSTPPTRTSPNS